MSRKIFAAAIAVIVLAAAMVSLIVDTSDIDVGEYPTNLMILGNANLDNYLDDEDIDYINTLLTGDFEYADEYFCDANYDGKIDSADIDYIEKMIDGDWDGIRYCYYLDANFSISKFDMTVEGRNLVTLICPPLDDVLILNPDLLVGTDMRPIQGKYLPQYEGILSDIAQRNDRTLVNVGVASDPDLESISQLSKDNGGNLIVVCGDDSYGPGMEDVLKGSGVQVIRIPTWEYGGTLPGLLTLAFMLDVDDSDGYDEMENALSFAEWYSDVESVVQKNVSTVADRPGVSCVYAYTDPLQILGEYTAEYNNSLKLGIYDVTGAYMNGQATGGHGDQIDTEVISELVKSYGLDVLVGLLGAPFQIEDNAYGNGGAASDSQGTQAAMKYYYDKWEEEIGAALDAADFVIMGYSFLSGVSEPLGEYLLGYYLYGETAGFNLDYLKTIVNEYCQWIGIYDIDGDGVSTHLDDDGRPYEWCYDDMNLLYAGEGNEKNIMNGV